jgi:hypothetical protein
MGDTMDTIADTLNIEPKEISRPIRTKTLVPNSVDEFTKKCMNDRIEDFTDVRDNIRNLIAEVEMVIGDAVIDVRTDPSARKYEAFCQLIQVYANANQQLLKMHEPLQKSNIGDSENHNPPSVNNVVFVGTSDGLLDQIKTHIR